jgi:hypothetical protein
MSDPIRITSATSAGRGLRSREADFVGAGL